MFAVIWIHILAAVVWVGGMVFLSVVLVPVLRRDRLFANYALLFRTVAYRFRTLVWSAMGMLVGTGLLMASSRLIPLSEPRQWPAVFAAKMSLVALLFSMTLLHDFLIGPHVRQILAMADAQRTARQRTLIKYSSLVPRLSLLIALFVLLLAVVLART